MNVDGLIEHACLQLHEAYAISQHFASRAIGDQPNQNMEVEGGDFVKKQRMRK